MTADEEYALVQLVAWMANDPNTGSHPFAKHIKTLLKYLSNEHIRAKDRGQV